MLACYPVARANTHMEVKYSFYLFAQTRELGGKSWETGPHIIKILHYLYIITNKDISIHLLQFA